MKVLVQTSGGLDSAAALLEVLNRSGVTEVLPVFYDYSQSYVTQEYLAAFKLVNFTLNELRRAFEPIELNSLDIVKLPLITKSNTSIKEYIPYRNLVLTAHSISYAAAQGYGEVVVGSKTLHLRDDAYAFKDSSWTFFNKINELVEFATEPGYDPIIVSMPLKGWSKASIVERIILAGIDADDLWTCYVPGLKACGQCYHCVEYKHALGSKEVQRAMHKLML